MFKGDMTTANQIIAQSLGLLGVKDPIETVGGTEGASALVRLNTMLDGWRLDSLTAYTLSRLSASVATATKTIGPAGDFAVTPRPTKIELGSFFTSNGIDFEITPISAAEYNLIAVKSTTGLGPCNVYMDQNFPTATLYFYPVPVTAVTVTLLIQTQITAFADLTTNYNLAPGYERAIVFSLAIELGPDYERDPPRSVIMIADSSKRALARTNARIPVLRLDRAIPTGRYYDGRY